MNAVALILYHIIGTYPTRWVHYKSSLSQAHPALMCTHLDALRSHFSGEGLETSARGMQLGKGVHVTLVHLSLSYDVHAHHIVTGKPERI